MVNISSLHTPNHCLSYTFYRRTDWFKNDMNFINSAFAKISFIISVSKRNHFIFLFVCVGRVIKHQILQASGCFYEKILFMCKIFAVLNNAILASNQEIAVRYKSSLLQNILYRTSLYNVNLSWNSNFPQNFSSNQRWCQKITFRKYYIR